ncbi:putative peptidoglycan lipid II flippase [Nonomuraea muscovyensis]|uniref:Putative peptidoglycan lipid II flippase n=1 Tax=Nonomuraea muscovyensis TaxID=1124761 RepID=A0A7X0EYB5_9ACTN|nr:lipid II flippase MurJ [Nonomuraea muscovyensis]MBB6348513.1 putative peptidoglycan lipid II flippase [Nonomuraea muscovyensis]
MTARLARGVAGGAMLIGAITILARVAGFAKQYAFAQTVGTDCLATAYFTANQIPNIVFEVVVGGALSGMVVPVLAGAAAASSAATADDRPGGPDGSPEARQRVEEISSALLTWVLAVLVPLGVLVALLAGPIMGLFFLDGVDGCQAEHVHAVATRMLVVFAPQIPLYGVAVVLYGLLQAHRRFAGPALAPLVSSIVVIVAYLVFVPLSGGQTDPAKVPAAAELALSVGTSLGVLALVLTVAGPVAGLGLRWRPTLRFPPGVAPQVRRLALAGVAALLAQQAAMIVVLVLSNKAIGNGAIAVYNYAWAIYLVPYAVLAVPIATSAFPGLSAQAEAGDTAAFSRLAAGATRAVVLVSGLAAGVLAAAAEPGAVVFLGAKTEVSPGELARTITLFAPGLVGYGLIAHLSRVLFAAGRGRAASVGTVAGWVVVMVTQTVFVLVLPDDWKIAGMALGMTAGMTAGGALLLAFVVRARGRSAATGLGRAVAAAVAGGVAGYLAGAAVVAALDARGVLANAGAAVPAVLAALVAGGLAVALVDRDDARAVAGRFTRRRKAGKSDG